MHRSLRVAALALVSFTWNLAAFAADDLEKQLLEKAPSLVKTLQEAGCNSVGVLKFHVQKGANPLSDRVGTLNRRLSDKLELALILKNPKSTDEQVRVLRDPNKIAATIPGAVHTTAAGRELLFSQEYPQAWGKDRIKPDAFLIGEAVIAPDLKTMDVFVRVFTRGNPSALINLCKLEKVKLDLEDLLDAGESFSVRGVFDQGKVLLTAADRKDQATATAVQTALVAKPSSFVEPKAPTTPAKSSQGHPLSPDSDAPVSLEILYDNQPQPILFQGGIAFVAGPKEGQTVLYVVRRKTASTARYGVVLKVNGENTLFKQRMSDDQCTPWVFESKTPAFSVSGYRLKGAKEELFRVLSESESKAKEVDYGDQVGLVSISVFPEKPLELVKREEAQRQEQERKQFEAELKKQPLNIDDDDFAILNRAEFPENPGDSLKDLKNSLAGLKDGLKTRGVRLISGGPVTDRKLDTVPFQPDNLPIMSAVVRYYNPSDLPK